MLNAWIAERIKELPVYEGGELSEDAIKRAYESVKEEEDYVQKIIDCQRQLTRHFRKHTLPSNVDSKEIAALTWELECGPEEAQLKHSVVINDCIDTLNMLTDFEDANLSLRQSIERLQYLKRQLSTFSHSSLPLDASERMAVLHAKSAEYNERIQSDALDDLKRLLKLMDLLRERDGLDKELSRFHGLPVDPSEALIAIAKQQSELDQAETERANLINTLMN